MLPEYKKYDWSRGGTLRFQMGLALSLAIVLTAFEWKTAINETFVDMQMFATPDEVPIQVRQTIHTPPPPPKIINPVIVEVPDDEKIVIDNVDLNVETNENQSVVPPPVIIKEEIAVVEEPDDEPVLFVEEPATPAGGMEGFYKFLKKTLKYPNAAKRMNIEGMVILQFTIEKDGSLTDFKMIRGIGGGCDEEALRVMQQCPAWNAGKQRGRPVRQRMTLPIRFALQ